MNQRQLSDPSAYARIGPATSVRRAYEAPGIVHEAELETRAGTPTGPIGGNVFDPITESMVNPWDPDYTAGPGQ